MRSPGVFSQHRGRIAALLALAALITAMLLASDAPDRARAAPCPAPTVIYLAGNLSVAGTAPCDFSPEEFRVYCSAGTVVFDYTVNGAPQGTANTALPCSAPSRLTVIANDGADRIDLSAVTAAAGFAAISAPNTLNGGYGNDVLIGSGFADSALGGPDSDILLLRDGVADLGDCGAGIDAAQADRAGLDSLTGCEVSDVLPTPASQKKKCKKKGSKGAAAAKKCKKKKGR
jgi:hypothetical protein